MKKLEQTRENKKERREKGLRGLGERDSSGWGDERNREKSQVGAFEKRKRDEEII